MDIALSHLQVGGSLFAAHVRNGQAPKALWDFGTGVYTTAWTFARPSDARWFDPEGTLQTVAANVPRLVQTAEGRALILETATRNHLNPAATYATALTSVAAGPTVGGVAFTTLTDNGDGNFEFQNCDVAGLASGTPLTFSVIVRPGTTGAFQLWLGIGPTGSSRVRSVVDLSVPSHAVTANPDGPAAAATVTAIGGGSYLLALTGAITVEDVYEQMRFAALNGSVHYALPQLETSGAESTPVPGFNTTRAADVVSLTAPNGSYTAVIRRVGVVDMELPVTVTTGTWTPAVTGKIKSVALY